MWRETIARAYEPAALYARFDRQVRETYPNRKKIPVTRARVNIPNVRRALSIIARVFWRIGIRADYRAEFWPRALRALRRGNIEELIHISVVAHHLILFARECADGRERPRRRIGLTPPWRPAESNEIPGSDGFGSTEAEASSKDRYAVAAWFYRRPTAAEQQEMKEKQGAGVGQREPSAMHRRDLTAERSAAGVVCAQPWWMFAPSRGQFRGHSQVKGGSILRTTPVAHRELLK
jgi:hypothetical protein